MTKDEALKMAIEVLNEHEPDWECNHGYHHNQCPNVNCECKEKKYWKTLDACKEAVKSHFEIGIKSDLGKDFVYTYRLLPDKDGLYWMLQSDLKEALEQPAQKPELADTISVEDYQKLREQPVVKESLTVQEPVRRQCIVCETEYDDGIPPKVKQPTQPLEIEIINNLYDMAHERDGDAFDFDHTKFARSIEQAHGIVETKND